MSNRFSVNIKLFPRTDTISVDTSCPNEKYCEVKLVLEFTRKVEQCKTVCQIEQNVGCQAVLSGLQQSHKRFATPSSPPPRPSPHAPLGVFLSGSESGRIVDLINPNCWQEKALWAPRTAEAALKWLLSDDDGRNTHKSRFVNTTSQLYSPNASRVAA